MRNFLAAPIFFIATAIFAAPTAAPSGKIRTIENTPSLAAEHLEHVVSPTFYKKFLTLPIEGWIIVRARLSNTRLVGPTITQSELNGAYDARALELANQCKIKGVITTGTAIGDRLVYMHLLIYNLKNAKMALSFVHMEQVTYYPYPQIDLLKNGKWQQISPTPRRRTDM
jgi:cytochrome b561